MSFAALSWPAAGLSIALGYVLGSIPSGLIFTWLAGAGDVRKIGSGNIGATNVLRTGNRWAAAATLLFDAGKGAAAVLIAHTLYGDTAAAVAGLGAFLGHLFPVWLGFKGGKGVATFFGVTLALCWPAGLLALATWLVAAAIWRISSLSALLAATLTPVYTLYFGGPVTALLTSLLALLIFVMHRENIVRMARGEEPRIGGTKPSPT
jgi:glycerol-3-phosphate acyltransferase PlsY